ncbi:hypothetical protein T02_966 [Trichinella nativa]|uniref:Uncharacterized protein n=1 Tax=Trichinella nativa TaxID=6335 RepID=A0A0V1L9Q3_9BILA|nr:hypothetical protein T02_522 [Trichinella nativa]KRZ56181.1 hypothetical protein T02_966 [Trichinella nativa]
MLRYHRDFLDSDDKNNTRASPTRSLSWCLAAPGWGLRDPMQRPPDDRCTRNNDYLRHSAITKP